MKDSVSVDPMTMRVEEPLRGRARFRRWTSILWAPVALVAASFVMCLVVVGNHSQAFSPVDEMVYYDYLVKVPQQGVVHQGEHVGVQTREHMSCYGFKAFGTAGSACGGDYGKFSAYPYKGVTSADAYTPLYFDVTWVLAKPIQFIGGFSLLTAGRLTGFFWLAGGLLLFYRLARDLRVPKLAIVAVGLGFVASKFAWWTYTYLSTDVSSVLFGGLLLLLTVRFLNGRLSGWWLVPAGALAVAFKVTNVFAVGLSALVIVCYAIGGAFARRRRQRTPVGADPGSEGLSDKPSPAYLWLIAACTAVGSVAIELVWLAIRSAIAVGQPPYAAQGIRVGAGIDWGHLAELTTAFLPSTIRNDTIIPGPARAHVYAIPEYLILPFSWLLIAGVLAYLFWPRRRSLLDGSLALSIAVSAVVFAPVLAVAMTVIEGASFPLPARYGAPLLPGFLLAAVMLIRGKVASWAVLVYGGLLLAYVLVSAPIYAP